MNFNLPEINGIKTTKMIRRGYAGAAHKLTPIVALTENEDSEARMMCFEAGVNSFLNGPVNAESIEASLTCLLKL